MKEIQFNSYSEIKNRILVKPAFINKHFTDEAERRPFVYLNRNSNSDIALVPHVIVSDTDDALMTVKISKDTAEHWEQSEGIDVYDIYTDGMKNTAERFKPMVSVSVCDVKNCAQSLMQVECITSDTFLVTTDGNSNGAIAMWYAGVRRRISHILGDTNFYVAFTSRNEAIIHKEGSIDVNSIRRNIRETNRIFGDADTLSNEVWKYTAGPNFMKATFAPVLE